MPRNGSTATLAPPATAPNRRSGRGLRAWAFAVVLLILIQYGLGMWVNLFATIPGTDHGKGAFAAFGAAVARGPAGLALHIGLALLCYAIIMFRAGRAVTRR